MSQLAYFVQTFDTEQVYLPERRRQLIWQNSVDTSIKLHLDTHQLCLSSLFSNLERQQFIQVSRQIDRFHVQSPFPTVIMNCACTSWTRAQLVPTKLVTRKLSSAALADLSQSPHGIIEPQSSGFQSFNNIHHTGLILSDKLLNCEDVLCTCVLIHSFVLACSLSSLNSTRLPADHPRFKQKWSPLNIKKLLILLGYSPFSLLWWTQYEHSNIFFSYWIQSCAIKFLSIFKGHHDFPCLLQTFSSFFQSGISL